VHFPQLDFGALSRVVAGLASEPKKSACLTGKLPCSLLQGLQFIKPFKAKSFD
jgi:hypothetical protein